MTKDRLRTGYRRDELVVFVADTTPKTHLDGIEKNDKQEKPASPKKG